MTAAAVLGVSLVVLWGLRSGEERQVAAAQQRPTAALRPGAAGAAGARVQAHQKRVRGATQAVSARTCTAKAR